MDTTDHLLSDKKRLGRSFTVTVKGEKDKTEKVLSGLTAVVTNLSFVSEEDGKCTFTFDTEKEDDIREDVSFALSDERLLVLSLSEEKKSLEDIYLAIMEESDKQYEEELRLAKEAEEEDDDEDIEEDEQFSEESDESDGKEEE